MGGQGWKHFKDNLAELKYTLQLWHSHLKKIEGNFGTDVLSYFVFLKWLLLINIPTLLLTVGFILVPQFLFRWFQQDPTGYPKYHDFTGLELLTGAVSCNALDSIGVDGYIPDGRCWMGPGQVLVGTGQVLMGTEQVLTGTGQVLWVLDRC